MSETTPKDLIPTSDFPLDASWAPADAKASLEKIYAYVTEQAKASREWYWAKRERKKRGGYVLRLAAMLLTALGGVVPVLSEILRTGDTRPWWLHPTWATVFIALAALVIAIDRFGDWTSGWVRYINTAQELGRLEEEIRFDWQIARLRWPDGEMSATQAAENLQILRSFLEKVHGVIRAETTEWSTTFKSTLEGLESQAKILRTTYVPGGLNVRITNRDDVKGAWHVRLDNGQEKAVSGESTSFANLAPRVYEVSLRGIVGGAEVSVGAAVVVGEGQVQELKLALK